MWAIHPFTANTSIDTWWADLFGEGKVFDIQNYCIICPNIPGSPYGSSYPLDINPITKKKYYYDFPVFSPRDIVDMFDFLRQHLSIPKIDVLVGASMGGQIAFQWTVSYPQSMRQAVIIAADAKVSPWAMAMHEVQRSIIQLDSSWGKEDDNAGKDGMNIARQMAIISYRSSKIFQLSQAKNTLLRNDADEQGDTTEFEGVRAYLEYQGSKFLSRFNAFSYCALIDMMNRHDVSFGYASMKEALTRIAANMLLVGVDSDILFPVEDLKKTASLIPHVSYREISSVYGHDAFLIEKKQLDDILQNYFSLYQNKEMS